MMHCGHGYRSGFYASKKFFHVLERLAAKLRGDRLGLGQVSVHYRHQLHPLSLLFQLVIDASVVLAERTYTNDRYSDCTLVSQTVIFSERGTGGKGYHPEQRSPARVIR
jgi:hypothetical protein